MVNKKKIKQNFTVNKIVPFSKGLKEIYDLIKLELIGCKSNVLTQQKKAWKIKRVTLINL